MKKVGFFFFCHYTFVFFGGGSHPAKTFLHGSELRAEIENQVAYANASAYTVYVDYPENCGIVKSPAGGEVSKKVSDVFTVDFEPASDWEFIRWKIIDSVTGNEIPGGEYLSLSALSESKTECTFKKAPSDVMKLCLVPELAERPQIISCSPTSSGMIKNSVIQVLFDRKMDPGSIYYTAPEIKSLKESGVKDEDFLPPVDGTDKNHYGYQKGGKTFFKNISIKNKKTDANLNGCFAAPVFDNESTLSISVKDKDSIDENGNGKYTLGWNVPSEKDYNGAVVSYGIKGSAPLGTETISKESGNATLNLDYSDKLYEISIAYGWGTVDGIGFVLLLTYKIILCAMFTTTARLMTLTVLV